MTPSKSIQLTEQERRAASQARAEYMRNWRAKNREKERMYKDRYWAKRAKAQLEAQEG